MLKAKKKTKTISHSDRSLLAKFYMHQENNAPFMKKKNVNFAFFRWTLLGYSKKNTDIKQILKDLKIATICG